MAAAPQDDASVYSAMNGWSLMWALKPSNTSFTCGQLFSFFMLLSQRVTFG